MFTFFKTLDNVSKRATDFLKEMGIYNVTIEKFSYKQEGAEETESRIILVDGLKIWEVYKQNGKILQKGLELNEKSKHNTYAHSDGRHAQRLLEASVQENDKTTNEDFSFF